MVRKYLIVIPVQSHSIIAVSHPNLLVSYSFEADAESECEKAVTAALTAEPDSLDGLQSMASLRLSQNRKSDAAEIMDRVHERISHIRQVVAKRTVLDEMAGVPEPTEFQGNSYANQANFVHCHTTGRSHKVLCAPLSPC